MRAAAGSAFETEKAEQERLAQQAELEVELDAVQSASVTDFEIFNQE